MLAFFKNAMDWVLEKERDAANNCSIDTGDVEKQIRYVEQKRDRIKEECEENLREFEHILNRLHAIRASAMTCDNDKNN